MPGPDFRVSPAGAGTDRQIGQFVEIGMALHDAFAKLTRRARIERLIAALIRAVAFSQLHRLSVARLVGVVLGVVTSAVQANGQSVRVVPVDHPAARGTPDAGVSYTERVKMRGRSPESGDVF
jgi:hypothetical protein